MPFNYLKNGSSATENEILFKLVSSQVKNGISSKTIGFASFSSRSSFSNFSMKLWNLSLSSSSNSFKEPSSNLIYFRAKGVITEGTPGLNKK